jgi:hypothetical protein
MNGVLVRRQYINRKQYSGTIIKLPNGFIGAIQEIPNPETT